MSDVMDQTLDLALPHRAGKAAGHDENAQLEEGYNQTAPPNDVCVGGPEVDELPLASVPCSVNFGLTHPGPVRVSTAGGRHRCTILFVSGVTTALEL